MLFFSPTVLVPILLVSSAAADIGNYKWRIFNYKGECGEPTSSSKGNCVYKFNVTAPQYTTPDDVCIGAFSAFCKSTKGAQTFRYCDILEWTPCGEDDTTPAQVWSYDRYTNSDESWHINMHMIDDANTYSVAGHFEDHGEGVPRKFGLRMKTYS